MKAGRPKDDTASNGWWCLALEEGEDDGTKAKVVPVAPAERTAAMARAETLNFIVSFERIFWDPSDVLVFYICSSDYCSTTT